MRTKLRTYTLYAIMVIHPATGEWTRIGSLHRSKEAAQSWRSFAKNAVYARRSKVVRIQVELDDNGHPTEAAKKMMSNKFNVEVT